MSYFMESCDRLNANPDDRLRFVGFGIRHPRLGVEQIIPNLYNNTRHYSLVFNHEPVKVRIDGEEGILPGNTLVVWDQSHRVVYGETGLRWRLTWLQLQGEELNELLARNDTPLNQAYSFDNERIIEHYWLPICEEFSEYIRFDPALVLNYINGILLEINRIRRNDGSGAIRIPEAYRKIRNFLDSHYMEELTLTDLAGRMHLAPAYFSRKYKEYFGLSPIDYIILRRLHDAVLSLQNPELSIQEVAESAGYRDCFYFSKLFKRHFGMAPRLFRERLRSKIS